MSDFRLERVEVAERLRRALLETGVTKAAALVAADVKAQAVAEEEIAPRPTRTLQAEGTTRSRPLGRLREFSARLRGLERLDDCPRDTEDLYAIFELDPCGQGPRQNDPTFVDRRPWAEDRRI